jgi:hypothetical protein
VLGEGTNVLAKWWLTYWGEHGGEAGSVSQYKFLEIYAGELILRLRSAKCLLYFNKSTRSSFAAINFLAIIAGFVKMMTVMLFALRASRW